MEDDQDPKQGKNIAKGIKNVVKSIFTKKILIAIIAILLIIAIISAALFELRVKNSKNSNNGIDPESKDYVEYGPEAYMSSVYITENGTLMAEMSIDEMWENDSRYSTYLSSKDALAYFLNAQLVSQYPYIESAKEGELNGTIRFYRNDSEEPMVYATQDDFDEMLNGGGNDIFNYFTITDNGSIKVAYTTYDSYIVTTDDDDAAEAAIGQIEDSSYSENAAGGKKVERTEGSTEVAVISYRSAVRKYVLPFNLLWTIIVMGNSSSGAGTSENFAHVLATMAYDGEVSLIIDDNEIVTVATDTYTYNETEHYDGRAKVGIHETDTNINVSKIYTSNEMTYNRDSDKTDVKKYTTTYTETHITHSPSIKIKKITSWVATYYNGATYKSNTSSNASNPDTSALSDTDLEYVKTVGQDGDIPAVNGKVSLQDWVNSWKTYCNGLNNNAEDGIRYDGPYFTVKIDVYRNYTDINLSSSSSTTSTSFMNNGSVTSPNLNRNIVNLFNLPTFSGLKRTLSKSSYGYFIRALEVNEDTANMVDLINYIFNKVYDNNKYYKGNEDFVTIWNRAYSNYSSVTSGQSGIEGNVGICFDFFLEKGCSPEGIVALLGCWNNESAGTFNPGILEYNSKPGYYDYSEEYTRIVNATNGNDPSYFISGYPKYGYGLGQWTTEDRKRGLYICAKNYADDHGTEFRIDDINVQLEFAWQEITSGGSPYTEIYDQLMNATDVNVALESIHKYETCSYRSSYVSAIKSNHGAFMTSLLDEYYANN